MSVENVQPPEVWVGRRHLNKIEVINAVISGFFLGTGGAAGLTGDQRSAIVLLASGIIVNEPFIVYQIFNAGNKKRI